MTRIQNSTATNIFDAIMSLERMASSEESGGEMRLEEGGGEYIRGLVVTIMIDCFSSSTGAIDRSCGYLQA